jgi:peptide-methionine (S)-S-oxide reductase
VREGFEPSLGFHLNTLSKRAPSTTRPPHQRTRVGRRLRPPAQEGAQYTQDRQVASAFPDETDDEASISADDEFPPKGQAMPSFPKKSLDLPTADTALPGRAQAIPTADTHFINGHPLKGPYPDGLETAVFAMGCFWGVERVFWQVPGRLCDRRRLCGRDHAEPDLRGGLQWPHGHTEVVQVVFDPKVVTYDALLKTFWENHDPTQGMRQGGDIGTQYRSGIYVTNDAQAAAAGESKEAYQQALSAKGLATSPPRSARPARSTSPRTITSSTWPRTRTAIAASAAPAWSARSASVSGLMTPEASTPRAWPCRARPLDPVGRRPRLQGRRQDVRGPGRGRAARAGFRSRPRTWRSRC